MSRRVIAVLAAATVAAGGLLGSVIAAQGQSSKSSKVLFAVMTGKKEVPAKGDSNGRGSFTAIVAGGQLCFGLTVRDISDPAAAHIHKGASNKAGPVLITLEHPSSSPGASSACVDVKAKDAAAILKNPSKYYVNVHTADFPGGAIRGQLFAKSN
jgi:hypothetical protein